MHSRASSLSNRTGLLPITPLSRRPPPSNSPRQNNTSSSPRSPPPPRAATTVDDADATITPEKLDDLKTAKMASSGNEKTEFAKRNPVLERYVPDFMENAVDKLLPDALEAKMDRGAQRVEEKFAQFKTDFNEGFGEVAGVLFKVAGYASSKFDIGDIVFGVKHLADHHRDTDARDPVRGLPVTNAAQFAYLLRSAECATWAYCPSLDALEKHGGVPREDVLMFDPTATPRRPAYVLLRDSKHGQLVWAFRGTTDLSDILTDLCATVTPYQGGHAHWGMLEAARFFAADEMLRKVRARLDEEGLKELQLCGHSYGAGVAVLLAHVIHNDPRAREIMQGIKVTAVGIATPAVLTAELAESCSDYITSVVQLHDLVPRFSIHSVFQMKDEMDATRWGDKLAALAADYAVPDIIEKSATYQRLQRKTAKGTKRALNRLQELFAALVAWLMALLRRAGLVKPEDEGARQQREALTAAVAASSTPDGEVVPVYAPGKLFFLDRRDPPKEEAERLKAEQVARREAAKKALANAAGKPSSSSPALPASTSLLRRRKGTDSATAAAEGDDDVDRAVSQARHAAAAGESGADGAGRTSAADLPDVQFYPGATFSLIEGAPGERFRRMVLRDTCLSDHLTSGTLQGLQQLLEGAKAQQASSSAAQPGSAGKKKPLLGGLFARSSGAA